MRITLNDIRNMFCKATKIVLVNDILDKDDNYIGTERIEINDLLWGTDTFGGNTRRALPCTGDREKCS